MEPRGDESEAISWIDFQHICTAMAGVIILIYIYIQGSASRNSSQHNVTEVSEVSEPHGSESYVSCQLPDCIRCKSRKDNQLLWNERLRKFLEKQTSENQLLLQDLSESFRPDGEELHMDFRSGTESVNLTLQNPTVYLYPRLKGIPWYELEAVSSDAHRSDIQHLKDKFRVIKADFENIYSRYLEGDVSGWSVNNVPSGSWNVFHLYNQGKRIEENCLRCGDTVEVLDRLKTFMRGVSFGYACFSVLQAGSHITPHCGPCNIRLRCHLGIQIPDNCLLTVAGESKTWKERDCLLFDDSFLHEAVNSNEGSASSDVGSRVILMVDLWHPDLSDLEKEAFSDVFSSKIFKATKDKTEQH